MRNRTAWMCLVLLLLSGIAGATHTCTTCYIATSGCADTNAGSVKASPWCHAPGMPNATSNASTQVPVAGDSYIFHGGDTWHFGDSAATVYTGLTTGTPCISYNCGFNWTWSGTATTCNYPSTTSSCIYIGVDTSWFSGGSFTRPIFNLDNPIWANSAAKDGVNAGFVTGCSFDYANRKAVEINASYVIFDNVEFTGMCWQTVPGFRAASDIDRGGNNIAITNIYVHGWTELHNGQPNGQSPYDFNIIISGSGTTANASHNLIWHSVFDGSDQGTPCNASGNCTGGPVAYADAYDFSYNVCRRIANCLQTPSYVFFVHDNLFENIYESYDLADHGSAVEIGTSGTGITGNSFIYNNMFRNMNIGETLQTMTWHGATTYVFNNVFSNIGNGGNCVYLEQFDITPTALYFVNNTVDGSTCAMRISVGQQDFIGALHFQNNHLIGVPASGGAAANTLAAFYGNTPGQATITDDGNEILQTTAVANGQGYTSGNNFQPISTSVATYHAGGNLSSSCSTFSSDSALCSGTTGGVTNTAGTGTIPLFYISATPARGSTFDAGAFQFSAPAIPPGGAAQNGVKLSNGAILQ